MNNLRRSAAHTLALSAGSAAAGMGAVVLAGWLSRSEALVRFGTLAVPTAPATALGLLLLGASASLLAMGARRASAWLWAPAVLAMSTLTLLERGLGLGPPIDGWPATLLPGPVAELCGRMSLPAAASMACASLAFAPLRQPDSARRSTVSAFLSAVPLAVGGFGLFEYALDSGWVYAWTQAMRLALPTAIGCVILGVALVSLGHGGRTRRGAARLAGQLAAGRRARLRPAPVSGHRRAGRTDAACRPPESARLRGPGSARRRGRQAGADRGAAGPNPDVPALRARQHELLRDRHRPGRCHPDVQSVCGADARVFSRGAHRLDDTAHPP
jgi:hypothetical protein